jgi:hypothetical protein
MDMESIRSRQVQRRSPQISDSMQASFSPFPSMHYHENFPSVALASTGIDPPKCGRLHQVELILTNS